ncbi:EAL domain-containing response regulator [Pseudomonas sp. NPDC086278]|uniref:EAL domain-containing response regulator n=1 Tax=Pseudomonas sp. NPDC086278 TaxID=3390646 RepID=UPI003CFDB452
MTPGLPLRVLVLEDHAFQRSVAVTLLRNLGCDEVFAASDGAAALAVLDAVGPVDIALCDLQMEGMDGLTFLQKVAVSKQVKSIIICSALSADLRRAVHQLVGLLGLTLLGDVGKPVSGEAVRALLNKHLAAPPVERSQLAGSPLARVDEVRRGLIEEQIQAWYQPKFNLQTGEVCGVEVLSRWLHPFKGVLPPAGFMPVLERLELMDELLFSQMDQALHMQQLAGREGFRLNMAFNLQAAQLANSGLPASVRGLLNAYSASGPGVTFELTESGLLEAPVTSLENLVRLRMMGCRLSIDDFGAGFSSLQRLCQLPFNEIKLDGEFVRSLEDDPRCRAVIGSTLALGETLGMSVVIEGIETEAQRQQLLALGCTQGQGYWFARPMSGEDLLRWLRQRSETQA